MAEQPATETRPCPSSPTRLRVAVKAALLAWERSTVGAEDMRQLYPLLGEAMDRLASTYEEGD